MSIVAIFSTLRCNTRYAGCVWFTRSFSKTSNETHKEANYDDNIKNKILEASLNYVNEFGWTKDAISAGAKSVGYPGVTHGLFNRGGADLIHYFQKNCNLKLVNKLKEDIQNTDNAPAELVEKAIKHRLEMIVPYIGRWPQAIAIMSLPPNVPNALATLLTMVDDICYHVGDRSVDFNWYARRIGIAGVYKATELYLIQDSSPEFQQSWAFLNRRLGEAVQIHQVLMVSDNATQGAKDTIMSAFVTARNILGLNWNR